MTAKTARRRRTNAEIRRLKDALLTILERQHPCTVRQTFYLAETAGLIPKTEAGYDTVQRYLVQMRREDELPYHWLVDNTRWMRKPRSYSSLETALQLTAQHYRRAMWEDQPVYLECWCEKDAIAGVLYEVTSKWDVPLMVARGFSSVTFLHNAAEAIRDVAKPTLLYYFGDHDPSGLAVDRSIEADLRGFAPDAEIHFERVAVLPSQISAWNLSSRPTKASDSRSKGFHGRSVEIEAIQPDRLRGLVRECIERHVDERALAVTLAAEKSERELLEQLCRAHG